jgi:hypothetical protein
MYRIPNASRIGSPPGRSIMAAWRIAGTAASLIPSLAFREPPVRPRRMLIWFSTPSVYNISSGEYVIKITNNVKKFTIDTEALDQAEGSV